MRASETATASYILVRRLSGAVSSASRVPRSITRCGIAPWRGALEGVAFLPQLLFRVSRVTLTCSLPVPRRSTGRSGSPISGAAVGALLVSCVVVGCAAGAGDDEGG